MSYLTEMNDRMNADSLPVIEWKGVRVVTTETLAKGYGSKETNIRTNLHANKNRFIEGVHFFTVSGAELSDLRANFPDAQISIKTRILTLWTEKGAARMSKIIDTDEAWDFFEKMEGAYFHPKKSTALIEPPKDYEESLEHLLVAMRQNRMLAAQRDKAIKEKAHIGERREATAMATASAAVRQRNALAEKLGESRKYAAILPVEKKLGKSFKWHPLKKWCAENGVAPKVVEDARYGAVKAWPAAAWKAVHGVNLKEIF